MNRMEIEKRKNFELLLAKMKVQAMNRHEMADNLKMNVKSFARYITELRFYKKIYIAKYERSHVGSYAVYYMAGNLPDAMKPVPLTQKEYNERYKAKKPRALKATKFTPRPDFAAHWLFNPIER